MPSCKKFISTSPPSNILSTQSVFNDVATATSAQTYIYTQMEKNTESYNLSMLTGLLGDELKTWSTSSELIQHYTNSMTPENVYSARLWKNAYNYIFQANSIIEGLQTSTLDSQVVIQLTGESKFIRAFWLFYLTNVFGDVPIITSTDYQPNSSVFRSKQSVVYEQIIADLISAKSTLNSNYVDGTSLTASAERVRPTKWAASALLARVYLYLGDYENALSESNFVLSNTAVFSLKKNLNEVYLKNSLESIWQIQIPLPTTINTTDGSYFILRARPSTGFQNSSTISDELKNSFEIADKRKSNWMHDTTISGQVYTFPYKYKIFSASIVNEYSMVLRVSEQYLIRSESNAQLGNTSAAISDLNIIRNRAGLANYLGSLDKNNVISAILNEKKLELFCEWGHRWFEMKRANIVDTIMSKVSFNKGGEWQQTDKLCPIPQNEIYTNPNLTQNAGY